MRLADQALLDAKAAGRDRVLIAGAPAITAGEPAIDSGGSPGDTAEKTCSPRINSAKKPPGKCRNPDFSIVFPANGLLELTSSSNVYSRGFSKTSSAVLRAGNNFWLNRTK